MNKIFLFDIDGTISYNGIVSNKTIEAFNIIKQNNDMIILSTGRCLGQMKDILNVYNFDGYILNNGALVIINNEIIYENKISKKTIDKMLNDKLHVAFLSKDKYFKIEENKIFSDFSSYFSLDNAKLENINELNNPIYSLGVYDYDINNIDYKKYDDLKFIQVSPLGFDVVNKDVNKSSSIPTIKEKYKDHSIIAFGDNYNDIEMLDNSDFSIVMGQASNEVKKHGNIITKSVNEDGVYYMVLKIYEDKII